MNTSQTLGMLLQSGLGSSQQRLNRAGAGGNPLLEAAMSMLQGQSGAAGGLGGLAGMLGSALGGGQSGGQSSGGFGAGGSNAGGLGGGGLGGMLGSLLGGGGSAGGPGGAGLMASLAKAALQQMNPAEAGGAAIGGRHFADPEAVSAGSPLDDDLRAEVMIKTMIAAAKADGRIDQAEEQNIIQRLEQGGASDEERRFVQDQLARPADIDSIASAVDSPHMAVEIYAAALFAIDVDTPAEQAFMQRLGNALNLPGPLAQQLHQSLEVRSV